MIGSGTFSLLVWLLPISTFLGGALICYWLVREIRQGNYRPKYGQEDLVQALEGNVPSSAIEMERKQLAQILHEEQQDLAREPEKKEGDR